MSNPQLTEIDASLHTIVRRAYELGRGDALKKVVEVLNAEPSAPDRLALMPPEATAPKAEADEAVTHEAETHEVEVHTLNGRESASNSPWWARPAR